MNRKAGLTLLACLMNAAVIAPSLAGVIHDQNGKPVEPAPLTGATDLLPTGKGWGQRPASDGPGSQRSDSTPPPLNSPFLRGAPGATEKGQPTANGIAHHGGAVMLGPVNVYFIWYGDWAGNRAVDILNTFADSIGGSPYYNINTTYYDSSKARVANAIRYNRGANSISDPYSQGPLLRESSVKAIVAKAISSRRLPADTKGVYFVLASTDVNEISGFCTRHCGWHAHGAIGEADIKYAFVGDPTRCLKSCAAQTTSPNDHPGADAMASTIAQLLAQAVTDPNLDAWYDSSGKENADKCAWTFGATYTVRNGAKANVSLGGLDYLIQQNWVNADGGYCALKYP